MRNIILLVLLFAGSAMAAYAGSTDILPINPVPGINETTPPGAVVNKPVFNGKGRIDRVETDQIVINDSDFRFSPHAEFRNEYGTAVSRSSFAVGMQVAWVLDDQDRIEQLWVDKE